jgi:hypothetical protein
MIARREHLKRTPLKRRPRKPRPEGWDDPDFLAWLRKWPCYVCLRKSCKSGSPYQFFRVIADASVRSGFVHFFSMNCGPTEAAHIGIRGLRQKSKDREAMPLGRNHHQHGPESHHVLGREFWEHHGLDRDTVLAILWDLYEKETGK